jgi:hypothetical protein
MGLVIGLLLKRLDINASGRLLLLSTRDLLGLLVAPSSLVWL